jgi:VIT1/CCC1 family predicted Fe2+/Mn2+ transporter
MDPIEKHKPVSKRPADIIRHYLGDIVYGANDGIITTFTVVSGVEGAKLKPIIVIILGLVNLFADGVSMGASRYLSIRASSAARGVSRGHLKPFYHAWVTFIAFVFFGAVPILSFIIPGFVAHRFLISATMTAITLFVVGALRVFVTAKGWLRGGLEMLTIGGVAAIIAYGVGFGLAKLVA